MSPIESEIAALDGLTAHDLRIAWRRLYRERPPRCLSRDLMIRAIAYRMQGRARSGHPTAAAFSYRRDRDQGYGRLRSGHRAQTRRQARAEMGRTHAHRR